MLEPATHVQSENGPGRGLRAQHFINREDLLGRADYTGTDAAVAFRHDERLSGTGLEDQLVIATRHHCAPAGWFAWPSSARRLDLSRFDRVVITSGDGNFAEPCAGLQEAGIAVTVVYAEASLSRRLAFAVRDRIHPEVPSLCVIEVAA